MWDNMCNEKKKKGGKKVYFSCSCSCLCLGICGVLFFMKKNIRGIERQGCKDGFINFKYY